MSISRRLAEAPPSWRWHTSAIRTSLLYRRAFGGIGPRSVIVRPHQLQGVDRIYLGSDCAVYDTAWLACEPGGGPLHIGDRTYLGHGVHVHAIDPIIIGADCVLADGVLVATSDHDATDRHAVHGTGPISIGDRVFLGQRAIVLGGVQIGDGATIGAHAVVTRDVAPGQTVVGIPATPVSSQAPALDA